MTTQNQTITLYDNTKTKQLHGMTTPNQTITLYDNTKPGGGGPPLNPSPTRGPLVGQTKQLNCMTLCKNMIMKEDTAKNIVSLQDKQKLHKL